MKKWVLFSGSLIFLLLVGGCAMKAQEKKTEKKETTQEWVTTWSQAQKGIGLFPVNDNGKTVAYEVPLATSGKQIRLSLGNYYGQHSVQIKAIRVSTKKTTAFQKVTVNKQASVTLAAQSSKKTDPINLEVKAGTSLFVRIYYAKQADANRAVSGNTLATSVERSTTGNYTTGQLPVDKQFVDTVANDPYAQKYAKELAAYQLRFTLTLEAVDVRNQLAAHSIVAFGDSITEQNHWVAPLQTKVRQELGENYQVTNAGISGNRLLRDLSQLPRRAQYFGVSGLERFDHDVYQTHANVSTVILALGINDLHQPGTESQFPLAELPTYDALIKGYQTLIQQAKKQHSRVFLATLTPFIGYTKDVKNSEKEALRQKINAWMRQNKTVNGVFDFDQVLAVPDKGTLKPEYDSGDHLHPNAAGGQAMADLIQSKVFREK